MIRLLLTFLALVSGFADDGARAEARVAGGSHGAVAIVQMLRAGEAASAPAGAGQFAPAQPASPAVSRATGPANTPPPARTDALAVTAVRVPVDRAHE